jgi:hypothetical protein
MNINNKIKKEEENKNEDNIPIPLDPNNLKFGIFSSLYGNPHPVMYNPNESSPLLLVNNHSSSLYQHDPRNKHCCGNSNIPLEQIVKVENDSLNVEHENYNHNINNKNFLFANNYNTLHNQKDLHHLNENKFEGEHNNISSLINMIYRHKETNKKPRQINEESFDKNKYEDQFFSTDNKKVNLSKSHSNKINSSFQKCNSNNARVEEIR